MIKCYKIPLLYMKLFYICHITKFTLPMIFATMINLSLWAILILFWFHCISMFHRHIPVCSRDCYGYKIHKYCIWMSITVAKQKKAIQYSFLSEWNKFNFQQQFSLGKRPEKSRRLHPSNLYNQIIMWCAKELISYQTASYNITASQ
jgi:hypothetical protein